MPRRGKPNEEADSEIHALQGLPDTRQVQSRRQVHGKGRIQEMSKGLYAAIHAKRERIKAGSGETMRKPGTKGAPTASAFKASAKTAKKGKK
jgi:hypothetical protein